MKWYLVKHWDFFLNLLTKLNLTAHCTKKKGVGGTKTKGAMAIGI